MSRGAATLAALLALAACGPGGQPPAWDASPAAVVDLRVSVSPTEVPLMQPVTVTVDLYRQRGVEVEFTPEFGDGDWVEQARTDEPARLLGDGEWARSTITLLPVNGPGELRIPELRAEVLDADGEVAHAATSAALVVLVTSVLAAEHGDEIEAPGDPIEASLGWWWLAAGAAAAVAAALALRARRRGREPTPPVAIDVPAHVRALRELQRWRGAARATAAEVEAFYVGVSQVLRVYLEQRFGLHAPERTTEEFLRELESGDGLARRHRSELERFLSQCDMVKFAKVVPSAEEHDRTFALAEAFVDSTRADRADQAGGAR